MKRVKIMLSAIAVLAVVGGALAFKAQKFAHKNVFCSTFPAPNTCRVTDAKFTIAPPKIANPCGLDAQGNPIPYYSDAQCLLPTTSTVTVTNVN